MYKVLNVLPHTGYENGRSNLFIRYYNQFDKTQFCLDMATTYQSDKYLQEHYDRYIGIVPKNLNYDIIHYSDTDDYHYNIFRRSGAKLVATWHNDLTWDISDDGTMIRSWFPYSLNAHAFSPPDILLPTTFTGEVKAKDFVSCKVKAILNRVVNPNSVVKRQFYNFVVGSVGKVSKVYGVDFIIELAKKLSWINFKLLTFEIPEDPNGHLLITHLPTNLELIDGRSNSVDNFLDSISLFIFTGRFCALPLVIQEAAQHSLPIISWDVGNCDILTENLIPKWDLDSFSTNINNMGNIFKSNMNLYSEFSLKSCQRAIEKCNIKTSITELENVYKELIDEN